MANPEHSSLSYSHSSNGYMPMNPFELERDLRRLYMHRDTALSHIDNATSETLTRICGKLAMLENTSSHANAREILEEHFPCDFVPKIGTIGALFRGYDSFRGDRRLLRVAPTVVGSPMSPPRYRSAPPETSLTIFNRGNTLPPKVTINHKGSSSAYVFFVGYDTNNIDDLRAHLDSADISSLGLHRYKLATYDGEYRRVGSFSSPPHSHSSTFDTTYGVAAIFALVLIPMILAFLTIKVK